MNQDIEFIINKIKSMPDHQLKVLYENYVYELVNEIIPYTDFSDWYLLQVKCELSKRGYALVN